MEAVKPNGTVLQEPNNESSPDNSPDNIPLNGISFVDFTSGELTNFKHMRMSEHEAINSKIDITVMFLIAVPIKSQL